MRILMLTKEEHSEPRSGGPLRTRAIASALESLPADVDVFALLPTPALHTSSPNTSDQPRRKALGVRRTFAAGFRVVLAVLLFVLHWCPETRHKFSVRSAWTLATLNQREHFDATIIEYSQCLTYRPVLRGPIILDLHNIESDLVERYATSGNRHSLRFRFAAMINKLSLRRLERRADKIVNLVTVVSDADKARILELGSGRDSQVLTVPNGVADRAFQVERHSHENRVVFVGFLGWGPNVDAARWLVQEVWPLVRRERPSAQLVLAGRSPAPEVLALASGDSISVIADAADVIPLVASAKVATAPLLAAGGTRLKILEALGCGTPVVATRLGALGLEALEGPCLRLADSPSGFAEAIVDLMDLPPNSLSSAARQSAEPYRWQATTSPLLEVICVLGRG